MVALEFHIARVRRLAGYVKAIYGYLFEDSGATQMDSGRFHRQRVGVLTRYGVRDKILAVGGHSTLRGQEVDVGNPGIPPNHGVPCGS